MAKRKSTGKRQRFNIFKRDRFTCQYCGNTPPTVVLVVDHIVPVAAGGESDESNLITSCEACNQGKADGLLSDVPRPLSDSLQAQIEQREQYEEYNKWLIASRKREQKAVQELGSYWCDLHCKPGEDGKWIVSKTRLSSISTFCRRLPTVEIYEAMEIAHSRKPPRHSDEDTWKYFCGICWSKIRQREGDE